MNERVNRLISWVFVSIISPIVIYKGIEWAFDLLSENEIDITTYTLIGANIFYLFLRLVQKILSKDGIIEMSEQFRPSSDMQFYTNLELHSYSSRPGCFSNGLGCFNAILQYLDHLLLAFGSILIIFVVPALLIIGGLYPENPTRAINFATIFLSFGIACVYYFFNKEKFKTLADKLTFFSVTGLLPVSVINFLFI
ncbi:MAG: hypothetical protein ED557_06270 [Balneola sp.]|nr:MAG: hypothetical protein ED557_06270 [Balneola sp.]